MPRFQATLELGVCAMILRRQSGFRLVCWLRLNVVPFRSHSGWPGADRLLDANFWWGMMLIMLVSVHWNLTPVSGRVSDMVFLDDSNPLTGLC